MNKKMVLAIVAIAVVGGLIFFVQSSQRDDDQDLTLYGNVDIREVNLAFRVAGRLDSLSFDEGDAVRAGDLLATLDAEPYEQSVNIAQAQVDQAQANLNKLRAGNRPQEVRSAAARLAEAEADRANALTEVTRLKNLIADGATSQRELDAAIARDEAARARLNSSRENLALVEAGFRDEDIAAAEAQLAAAGARLAETRTRLEDTRLLAPSNGTLITRAREPGTVLGAGETVYTLSLDEPVWVRAYVDESGLGRVRSGMRVAVKSDSSSETYAGQIGFISPRAEFTPRTVETESLRTDLVYRLRIVVTDTDSGLRQGMPVTVTLDGGN